MSAAEMLTAIKMMIKLGMSPNEIIAELKKTRHGDEQEIDLKSLIAELKSSIPSANEEGTKPVITKEELDFEQNASRKGITTEMQKTLDAAVKLREVEKKAEKNETENDLLDRRLRF